MIKRIISIGITILIVIYFGASPAQAKSKDDDVLSQHIMEADGTSGQDTNSGSGVKTGHIQDGALTPSKIGFYGNVAIVAPSGGDYPNPAIAMADFASWCGTPSETNPCLLKIMPGVYNIGSSSVVMQEYVDIEGSGEVVTKIIGNTSTTGVVEGASNTEIRFLSVENIGAGAIAVAISNYLESPKITNVTATASGGTDINCGVKIDHSQDSALTMTNVTATASGGTNSYGIWNIDSNPTLMNVKVTASGSTNNYGVFDDNDLGSAQAIKIEHSVIYGETASIKSTHFGARVASTRLEGGSVINGTDTEVICAGVYDEGFIFYPNTCP